MFKKLFFGLLLILAAIAAWFAYQWYFTNDNFMRQINLVPGDAVYVLQTDEPVRTGRNLQEVSYGNILSNIQNLPISPAVPMPSISFLMRIRTCLEALVVAISHSRHM